MEPPVIVELTPQDALLFVSFQKRYAFFQLLEMMHVFDLKNGSITVNFDPKGAISSVEKKEVVRP